MSSLTVEELLEHADWLRQLAHRLVADPAPSTAPGTPESLDVASVPGEYRAHLLAEDASNQAAVEEARRRLGRPDPALPQATFTRSAAGAQVQLVD